MPEREVRGECVLRGFDAWLCERSPLVAGVLHTGCVCVRAQPDPDGLLSEGGKVIQIYKEGSRTIPNGYSGGILT